MRSQLARQRFLSALQIACVCSALRAAGSVLPVWQALLRGGAGDVVSTCHAYLVTAGQAAGSVGGSLHAILWQMLKCLKAPSERAPLPPSKCHAVASTSIQLAPFNAKMPKLLGTQAHTETCVCVCVCSTCERNFFRQLQHSVMGNS